MEWRYGAEWAADAVFSERIERELNIIHSMGFDTYFLIVWDLCEFARQADIWWNVRGSGAASLVAYCLGVTNIDPIQNGLLFERFLNPGRVSMPDIDLDYPDDRRGEMIAYAAMKYGEDKVAAIITFGTMGAKAAVRDVGRALDVDLGQINRAAALIPQEARQKKIREYVDGNPELKSLYEGDAELQRVINTAQEKSLHVQMGYMLRYHSAFKQVAEWVHVGFLGDVFSVRAHMSTNISYEARTRISQHTGVIYLDLGGHVLDHVFWLLGRPEKVTSSHRTDDGSVEPFKSNSLTE